MAKTVADVMKMVKENEVKFVDFRFTDTRGKQHHTRCLCRISMKKSSPRVMLSTVLPSLAGRVSKRRICS